MNFISMFGIRVEVQMLTRRKKITANETIHHFVEIILKINTQKNLNISVTISIKTELGNTIINLET